MTPVALFGSMGVQYTASPIVMTVENRSPTPLTLSIGLSRGPSLWQGLLKPGATARGAGKIRSDDHTTVLCRAPDGDQTSAGYGYVTNGDDTRVTIVIHSCRDIDFEESDLIF